MKFGYAVVPSFIQDNNFNVLATYPEVKMDIFLIRPKTQIPKIADNFIELVIQTLSHKD